MSNANTTPILAYKAFNKDWTCRDFQYEMGKTFKYDGNVKACNSGFHACEYPLDIFNYYNPCTSKFALVEASGSISKEDSDSKIASEILELKRELSVTDLVKAAIDYTVSRTVEGGSDHTTGYRAASSATGDQAASSATGDQAASSATGYRAASSATGDQAASSATGDRAASLTTGNYSSSEVLDNEFTKGNESAISTGYSGKVKAPLGCALFLVERDYEMNIINVWSGIVGKKKIKPNTWYTLKDGKPTIVGDDE